MRRPAVAVICVGLLVAGCGTEVAEPTSAQSSRPLPSGPPTTPSYQGPYPQDIPRRPPPSPEAYKQVKISRRTAPLPGHPAPTAGNAQVMLSCDYEKWSPQYRISAIQGYNPPGRHLRGDRKGDSLSAETATRAGLALGDHQADVLDERKAAAQFTEDSWPVPRVVTTFDVPRQSLTKTNVLEARNAYAKGCFMQYSNPVLSAIKVEIYAPWSWRL